MGIRRNVRYAPRSDSMGRGLIRFGRMATPARIGTGDVYPSSGVYLLAAALVVCSACSLLWGSTDTTQAPEQVGADPTVACDDAGGVRTRGVLAGHVWEAQVGLVR